MSVTLLKVLIAFLPAAMLFSGSAVLFSRKKSGSSFLQLLGAGMFGGSRSHAYIRSTSTVSLDALGSRTQRGPLSRFLECGFWPDVVSHWISSPRV